MNVRKACLIVLFLAVSICNPCLNANMVGAQSTVLEPVTIQLRWFHQFQFAGYYAAIEKGFYAEEGLRVSLREFEPGKDRIAPVLEGKAQYGVGDPSLLKLRMQGQPLVVLAQIFQHSPSVLITRRESGVFSPEELVGKKVMMPLGDFGSAAIQVMILDALGDLNRLSLIPQTYNHEKLITGDIDAMATYLSNEPFKLKSKGVAVNVIDPRSYGIDFYGDNLFTTEKEVDQQPDRVKKMVRATLKGWEYALEHKDEIIDLILKKYNPALGRNQLGYEAKVVDQMIVPDLVPIGEINPRRYERIAETYRRLGIDASWDPLVRIAPDGTLSGIDPDFLSLLNKRLGTDIQLKTGSWKDLAEKAKTHEIDGLAASAAGKAREAHFLFSLPYVELHKSVHVRAGGDLNVNGLHDLQERKVAIQQGNIFRAKYAGTDRRGRDRRIPIGDGGAQGDALRRDRRGHWHSGADPNR